MNHSNDNRPRLCGAVPDADKPRRPSAAVVAGLVILVGLACAAIFGASVAITLALGAASNVL